MKQERKNALLAMFHMELTHADVAARMKVTRQRVTYRLKRMSEGDVVWFSKALLLPEDLLSEERISVFVKEIFKVMEET